MTLTKSSQVIKKQKSNNLNELYTMPEVLAILRLWSNYASKQADKSEMQKISVFHQQLMVFIRDKWSN